MPWVAVDVALVVAALVAAVIVALRLWRQVRLTAREVRAARERLVAAGAELQRQLDSASGGR